MEKIMNCFCYTGFLTGLSDTVVTQVEEEGLGEPVLYHRDHRERLPPGQGVAPVAKPRLE